MDIRKAGSEELGFEVRIQDETQGSNIIQLNNHNEGYYTNDGSFVLEPNQEYIITSVHGDSRLDMKVFTNSEAKVDRVINEYGCLD